LIQTYRKRKLNIVLLSLIITRAITILAFPHLALQPDSPSYSNGGWLNFHQVSFLGHSPRGWVTPLLFALVPGNVGRELLQMSLSVIAWYLLYVELSRSFEKKRDMNLLAIGIALISTAGSVIQWETVLLGTSLQISTVLIIISLLIKLFRSPHVSYYFAGLVFTVFLLGIQKSSNLLFCSLILLSALYLASKKASRLKKLAMSASILVSLLVAVVTGANVDKSWPSTYSGYTLLWQLGGQSPAAPAFKNYLSQIKSVPECVYQEAPYLDLNASIGKVVNNCDGGAEYVSTKFKNDFIKFTTTHPQSDLKLASLGFGAALTDSSSHYGPSVQLAPSFLSHIFFGEVTPDHRFSQTSNQVDGFKLISSGEPLWLYTPGIFWILAGLGLFLFGRKKSHQRGNTGLISFIQINLIVNALLVFIILPSEWVRQSAPFIIPSLTLGLYSAIYLGSRVRNSRSF